MIVILVGDMVGHLGLLQPEAEAEALGGRGLTLLWGRDKLRALFALGVLFSLESGETRIPSLRHLQNGLTLSRCKFMPLPQSVQVRVHVFSVRG